MKIYCKHGVEAGLLIESSLDLDAEVLRTHIARPICEECNREMLADVFRAFAEQRGV